MLTVLCVHRPKCVCATPSTMSANQCSFHTTGIVQGRSRRSRHPCTAIQQGHRALDNALHHGAVVFVFMYINVCVYAFVDVYVCVCVLMFVVSCHHMGMPHALLHTHSYVQSTCNSRIVRRSWALLGRKYGALNTLYT